MPPVAPTATPSVRVSPLPDWATCHATAPFILGGMESPGVSAGDLIRQLGVSKQAASQLIDTLVLRGYLERATDPSDRRRPRRRSGSREKLEG